MAWHSSTALDRCSPPLLEGKRHKLFCCFHISSEGVCQNRWSWENESWAMGQVFWWLDGEGRSRSGVRVGKTKGGSETSESDTRRRLEPLQSRPWKSVWLSWITPRETWWPSDIAHVYLNQSFFPRRLCVPSSTEPWAETGFHSSLCYSVHARVAVNGLEMYALCVHVCVLQECVHTWMQRGTSGSGWRVDINTETERRGKVSWGCIAHAKKYRSLSSDDNGSFRNVSLPSQGQEGGMVGGLHSCPQGPGVCSDSSE